MYQIVIDSCGELTDELKKDGHFQTVSLELEIDGYRIRDDETFDQKDFLRRVRESADCPKSSCPSPKQYMEACSKEAERVYVVTLSEKLSGSYNSAQLGKQLYEEEYRDSKKQIHVFNSRSASVGETLIAMKIQELEEQGLCFSEVVARTEEYIESQHTYFVLETLETLRKSGRLTNLKALIANTLNIKPVMGSTRDGAICQLGQARGMQRALDKLVQLAAETEDTETRILAISHCNCPERAELVRDKLEALAKFKKIIIINTAGVSSMYANDGGVIIAV